MRAYLSVVHCHTGISPRAPQSHNWHILRMMLQSDGSSEELIITVPPRRGSYHDGMRGIGRGG